MRRAEAAPGAHTELASASDVDLLGLHVAGSELALQRLVERHQRKLFWAICRVGVPEGEQDDVFQEVVLRLHRHAPSFGGKAAVSTWMTSIARNTALSFLDEQRRKFAAEPMADFTWDQRSITMPAQNSTMDTRLDLQRVLRGLTPELRAVLLLTGVCGYSVRDAAARLGIPAGTVKSRKARACRLMQVALRAAEYDAVEYA